MIKIARVDISQKYEFIKDEGFSIDNLPVINVYFNGKYYKYENSLKNPVELLIFINKILNPLVLLNDRP